MSGVVSVRGGGVVTMMRSESMTVWRRWAMVNTVHSLNFCLMVCWMSESVLGTYHGAVRSEQILQLYNNGVNITVI